MICLSKNILLISVCFIMFQRKHTMANFYPFNCDIGSHLSAEKVPIGKGDHVYFLSQFVKNVLSFSSQYGGSYSISYAAANIIGPPCKFPQYGDFPQTFAMVCIFRRCLPLYCRKRSKFF